MRYDALTPARPDQGDSALARAKNTSRAEARRRTRETQRAELLEDEAAEEQQETVEGEPAPRPQLFKMPNVREDVRALPQILTSRRLLVVPLLLLVVGFVVTLVSAGLAPEARAIADLYIQFFFIPPALFTFFIAGFVAPRASYLVGLIYGLIAGAMWSAVILISGAAITTGDPGAAVVLDPGTVIPQMMVVGALYGTLAAAFAAWYRDFLRGMQERGRARRAEQESKARAKRRDERHESRRVAKRGTS